MAGTRQADVLTELDDERPDEPFIVQLGGRQVPFRPATGPPWRDLLVALDDWPMFVELFGPQRRRDIKRVERLPSWAMVALVRAWRRHHGLCATDAEHRQLVGMLSKAAYRNAVERDLRETHRLDLGQEWRARRWRRLLNLIDGLGRTSHLHEVMTQDDELAEAVLKAESKGDEVKPTRRMREFGPDVEVLSTIADRLGELIVVTGMTKGVKPRRAEPMPRPETAYHRARERWVRRKHNYTVARVFGYIDAKGKPTGRQPPGGTPPTS
ncbi:hypothetical protein AB0F93_00065 [Micromonospora tulbaghiae]|uniref:hypothetical protein n=1 Tax=Micromonospora tulbaghiae TaxID=479978 RepID=UPI0033284DD4